MEDEIKTVALRFTRDDYRKLKVLAATSDTSLSGAIVDLVNDGLTARGLETRVTIARFVRKEKAEA